jgi:hypothetical protein
MDFTKLQKLLNTIKEDLAKGKIAAMQKPVPQMPTPPTPVQPKQIDREARVQQMSRDPNFRPQNMAAQLKQEQVAENMKAAAKNARQDAEHKQKLADYHSSIKHWPMMVLHGDNVTGSVEGKQYSVNRDHPEHASKEAEQFIEHAHEHENPFRIKQGKTHRLTVKLQGGGPTRQLWVTPEQYKQALTTGWHVHDFKDEE